MKNKKPLTASQKQKKYRILQRTAFGGEFVSILTPFIILGAVNFDEWFVNNPESWKVSLGGSLCLALLGLATFLIAKKKEQESQLTNGWITMIVGWFAVAFIFLLLGSILDEIFNIMLFGGIGILGAFGLDITSKAMKNKADAYQEALKQVKKETILDEAKREVLAEQQPTE